MLSFVKRIHIELIIFCRLYTFYRILKFIQNFLKPRSFKIKVNEIVSDTKAQTEGISQGSVVSPSFFILKINKILAELPNDNRFQI